MSNWQSIEHLICTKNYEKQDLNNLLYFYSWLCGNYKINIFNKIGMIVKVTLVTLTTSMLPILLGN